jgi:hypothetical protein
VARRLAALCVALCALAGAVVARAATTGAVSGSASGLPTSAVPEGAQAISPKGVIGAVGALSAAGKYTLKLAPGAWIIETSSLGPHGPLTSLGAPIRVHAPRAESRSPIRPRRS